MKRVGRITAMVAVAMLGACDVTVNNKSVDNQVDAAADRAGNIAEGAGEALGQAGAAVENGADAIGNKVDRLGDKVHVNIDTNGGNSAADGNRH